MPPSAQPTTLPLIIGGVARTRQGGIHRLRHFHRHLEEPMGGIRRAFPIRPIRQVRLAPDRVGALDSVRVQVRRPCDLRNTAHKLNPRREHRCRVRRVCPRHVVLPHLQRPTVAAPLAGRALRRRFEVGIAAQPVARQPNVGHRHKQHQSTIVVCDCALQSFLLRMKSQMELHNEV